MNRNIPTPEEFFGFMPGSDRCMIRWDKLCEYYRALEKVSGRIKVESVGKTSEGNEFIMLFVSSEENIKNLEKYREISLLLARPEGLSEEAVSALADEGKAVCMQSYGLHSNEVGGPQCVPLVVYDFISAGEGEMKRALDDVIFIISPCSEPDGEIIFTDWYFKFLGTKYEGCCSPYLRHNYAGHSNNRDALREAVIESTYLNDYMFRKWAPQAFQDFHHEYPWMERMNIAPNSNPIYPHVSPIAYRETSLYGAEMAYALSSAGRKGIVSCGKSYNFYPATTFYASALMHNSVGMLAENADVNIATPVYIHPDKIDGTTSPCTECPDPWEGGEWHLSDIVDQMKIASEALVCAMAKNKRKVLLSMAEKAKRQTERGENDPIHTYLIPEAQRDASALHLLLGLLQAQGVSLYRTNADSVINGRTFPKGTYAVPLGQSYYAVIKYFLTAEAYPVDPENKLSNGLPRITDTANTCIALCMGIEAVPAMEKVPKELLEAYTAAEYSCGEFPLPACENASYPAVNCAILSGKKVYRNEAGDFSLDPSFGKEVRRPKIALLKMSFACNEEEGYTRNLLRRGDFDFEILMDKEIRETGVPERFDILIVPGERIDRLSPGDTKPDAPDEYHFGLGKAGAENVGKFVKRGGRLIA